MKILIINQHPQDLIGGSEMQCDLIATQLTRSGHEVIYLAVNGSRQQYHAAYTVVPATLRWPALRRVIVEHRPDVVYWRFNKRKFLASALLLKYLRVKVVFAISHINDTLKWSHKVRKGADDLKTRIKQGYRSVHPALASRTNHFGYYFVDGVIAQLDDQSGKLPVKKHTVISNSVETTSVPFFWKSPFILWASSIKTSKHPEKYLELARNFQDLSIDFLMVGKIQQRSYAYFQENPRPLSHFYYLGEKTYAEVNGMIQQALFVVHTCDPEGFPNIFIQAWMQGKPTVSLSYDPDNMIQNHQLGYVSGNFAQFVQDTRTLVQQSHLREEFGRNARAFAIERFLPEKNVQKLAVFLQEVSTVPES